MLIHVTGANGQVGKEVMDAVSDIGTVYGTDVDSMDITDAAAVSKTIGNQRPDVIINIAA